MMAEESSVERSVKRVVRRGDAHDDEGKEADQRGGYREHRCQARRAEAFQECNETLHQLPPGDSARGDRLGNYCLGDGFHMVNDD